MKKDNEKKKLIGFCSLVWSHLESLNPQLKEYSAQTGGVNFAEASLSGIKEAAHDLIEMGDGLSVAEVEALNQKLKMAGFPSFTAMREKSFRQAISIISRGRIKTENEWHILNSYVSNVDQNHLTESERAIAEQIMADFEMHSR